MNCEKYKIPKFIRSAHKSFFLLVLFTLAFGSSYAQKNVNHLNIDSLLKERESKMLNKPLSPFVAMGDDGFVNNYILSKKVTFINMWESHCAPCMAEMSTLNKLNDTLKNNPKFQFVSISYDDLQTIKSIKEKYNIKYPVYHLDQEKCDQISGLGYPTYFILNKEVTVKYVSAGGYLDEERIRKFLFSTIYPAILKEL